MSDTQVTETFEVVEPAKTETKAPTVEALRENGWTKEEITAAEKRGMVEKKEEPKPTEDQPKPEAKKEEVVAPIEEKKSSLPDFTFKTPEQEKAFLDAFGPGTPQRAMYIGMKNERRAKQAERAARLEAEKKAQELSERLAKLEKVASREIDEDGNPIDPEDKPLTVRQLKELEEKKEAERRAKEEELNKKARVLAEAQTAQEEYARSVYPDFDSSIELVADLANNLDAYIPDRFKRAQVIRLIQDMKIAATNADQIDLDDYNAAMIAYEIGKFHPNYGKKAGNATPQKDGLASESNGKPKDPTKANGGQLSPEQMKRIAENTQRRPSSASVGNGSGKRVIDADDVTAEDLNGMSYVQRQRYKSKHPERYAQLLRG